MSFDCTTGASARMVCSDQTGPHNTNHKTVLTGMEHQVNMSDSILYFHHLKGFFHTSFLTLTQPYNGLKPSATLWCCIALSLGTYSGRVFIHSYLSVLPWSYRGHTGSLNTSRIHLFLSFFTRMSLYRFYRTATIIPWSRKNLHFPWSPHSHAA